MISEKQFHNIVNILEYLNIKEFLKTIFKKIRFNRIPVKKPEILRILPHNLPAHTQGLYHDGQFLYESTGLYGQSLLRMIDPDNGKIVKSISLGNSFGEGIACINKRLVQLTWKSGTAFIYKIPEMVKTGQFEYNGDGWGITSKGNSFIMTDGSHRLYYRNMGFKHISTKSVTMNCLPLKRINDLVYFQGKIYANVLYENYIFEICEKTGRVIGLFDCSDLKANSCINKNDNVLNGIAYEEKTDTFFLTGKNWSCIFQVRLKSEYQTV